ncbi:unnamed protein product [Caenorhabditis angaria]|uniref:Uncharacterized protein n=1 Tax=Caenorhabditis angaria TaxID=860376 RepID=A0A9P1IVK2_9PELO|nr:unnamed protein product [Caenorhabditis angaria]
MVEVAEALLLFAHNSANFTCNQQSKQQHKQKENLKRKNVRFDDENTASTSDYLFKAGKEWNHIASFFNCEEKQNQNGCEPMDELLNLCNWYDQREKNPEIDFSDEEDSDDEIPYAAFALTYSSSTTSSNSNKTPKNDEPSFPTPPLSSNSNSRKTLCSSNSTRVSSLRLASQLCLGGSTAILVKRKSLVRFEEDGSSRHKNALELAFQGIMTTSPSEIDLTSPSQNIRQDAEESDKSEDDFWGEVEF